MGFEVTVVCQSEQKRDTYCSLAEGLGMPALEAMASGIPVFSSATTALSKICADVTLLVHLGDIGQISNEILQLDQKLDLRQNLVLRGLGRVRQYDWENATDVVRNAYPGYFGLTMNGSRFQLKKCLERGGGSVLTDHR
jgi:glycosyltransferase involved in cell wall biosynthesis